MACPVRTKRGIETKPRIPMRHALSSRTAQPWCGRTAQLCLGIRVTKLPMQGTPSCCSETAPKGCFGGEQGMGQVRVLVLVLVVPGKRSRSVIIDRFNGRITCRSSSNISRRTCSLLLLLLDRPTFAGGGGGVSALAPARKSRKVGKASRLQCSRSRGLVGHLSTMANRTEHKSNREDGHIEKGNELTRESSFLPEASRHHAPHDPHVSATFWNLASTFLVVLSLHTCLPELSELLESAHALYYIHLQP